MKNIQYLIIILIFIAIYSCKRPTISQAIESYKSYYNIHKLELDSIAYIITTNFKSDSFNKVQNAEMRRILKEKINTPILNEVEQIDYYTYGDSIKTIRVYIQIPKAPCISLSFFKKFITKNVSCNNGADSLYLGNCWTLFLIKQSPCYEPL